jgi:transposase
MSEANLVVGIDVAKAKLDVAFSDRETRLMIGNETAALKAFADRLAEEAPRLIVMEASGGYEALPAALLAAAGLPVAVVNARWVRDFARSSGRLAKTDRLDADGLVQFGLAMHPAPRALKDVELIELEELLGRRRQLVDMLVAEKQRLDHVRSPRVRKDVQGVIDFLARRLSKADTDLKQWIAVSPLWRERDELLRSVPGVGMVTSRTLIARLPELGQLSNKQIAALGGVAPMNRDSGRWAGQRHIAAGRADVRCVVYMACISAIRCNSVIRTFYQRLRAKGKPTKVALVACMHKLLIILNTMVRTNTKWGEHQPILPS